MSLPYNQNTRQAIATHILIPPSPLGGPRSPTKSPRPYSPSLLPPGSPHGVPLQSVLPMFSRIEHTANCPNKAINVGNRIIAPGSTFPTIRRELGCNETCYVQLASMAASTEQPPISALLLGFRTSLQKIFRDQAIDAADPEALAQLVAQASSYHPSQESPVTVSQIPPLSLPEAQMDYEPTVQVPDSQNTQDMAMTLGNGQNSDGTGIGDSQHAPTSQALPKRAHFSSPLEIGPT
ncbi:hypothetical protein L873DRAFT_1872251 [Choiromyces venosus 120613-1]|uniref:Uncharacterized protein n=1 Tax=Choiromyces venosus 120613-1 TaxID=1336337 RepID=A0A3N4IYL0_9PEZI|nr:hypothetical protein L873DRAFT_1872251 [Choiromyces venosus 120613-1]